MLSLNLKHTIAGSCLFLVLALTACGNSAAESAASASMPTPIPTQQAISSTPTPIQSTATTTAAAPAHPAATPVVATPATTPATGPQVILTPTPMPGGSSNSQQVILPDRTLVIQRVSKQQGNSADSTAVSLVLTMNNTGAKSIPNQASYYQLIGTEGDIFGYQSSATPGFFGTITAHSSRSGTIVFQVPTAALSGLRLLFRSELATETVFVQLTIH